MLDLKTKIAEAFWHYEFYTYGPDENETISLKNWLKSVIICMHGIKVERYLKQTKKVAESMPDNSRVTYKEFVAF